VWNKLGIDCETINGRCVDFGANEEFRRFSFSPFFWLHHFDFPVLSKSYQYVVEINHPSHLPHRIRDGNAILASFAPFCPTPRDLVTILPTSPKRMLTTTICVRCSIWRCVWRQSSPISPLAPRPCKTRSFCPTSLIAPRLSAEFFYTTLAAPLGVHTPPPRRGAA
jgi:hypothetical protein